MVNDKGWIEVVYALAERQVLLKVTAQEGATIETVIMASGILQRFPEINLDKQAVGVFGKLRSLKDKVRFGDRIEIYRPLVIDPKEARRKRAAKHR